MEIRGDYLAVSRPNITDTEVDMVRKTLVSGWWGRGPRTEEFEQSFAKMVGSKHALAVTSNSAGLDLVIKALELEGTVIASPTMSFATTAVVPLWSGCSTRLTDILDEDFCIDPADLTKRVKEAPSAVIAVNFAGHLANIESLRQATDGIVIEDCAHSLYTPGAGSKSDVAIWSLHALKTLPAGDGGVITLNDSDLYEKLLKLSWFGIESTYSRSKANHSPPAGSEPGYSWDYSISEIGYKAQMNDITASLALGQLNRLDEHLVARRHIQQRYNAELHESVKRPKYSETVQYYIARVAPEIRNSLINFLASKNIHTSVHYKPLHLHPLFENTERFEVADKAWLEAISLPCHNGMTDHDIDYVIGWVKEFFDAY
jgi:perosamine synthetase